MKPPAAAQSPAKLNRWDCVAGDHRNSSVLDHVIGPGERSG
jgi:hypothetical protein